MSETTNVIGHFVLDQKTYRKFRILVCFFLLNDKLGMGAKRPKKVQIREDCPKFQLVFNLFKRRNVHLIYHG